MSFTRFNATRVASLLAVLFMIAALVGCGGGGGGGGGSSVVTPTTTPATVSGTVNSVSGAPGIMAQATNKDFTVVLVDENGVTVPETDLDPVDPSKPNDPKNNLPVKDGKTYSFKLKNFNKRYQIIAKGPENEMLMSHVGKVIEGDNVAGCNADPEATAIAMVYGDNYKDQPANQFRQIEQERRNDPNTKTKISQIVTDMNKKRQDVLKTRTFSAESPDKLKKAYQDAVLGTTVAKELLKVVEGIEVLVKKDPALLPIVDKLKEILALVGTTGKRKNETNLKDAKNRIKTEILAKESTDAKASTDNKDAYKDAKIALGAVCGDLGTLYQEGASSGSTPVTGAPSLMVAYQTMQTQTSELAKKEFEEGFKAVETLEITANDKTFGRDKHIAAVMLKNASELAKEDPTKLDIAKKKADAIVARLDSEGKNEFDLPTGETFNRDKVIEEKGDALINAGRAAEAVEVFQDVKEEKTRNFGLGRAYLLLNDLESAYKNLKSSVGDVVKSADGSDARLNLESKFEKINEALFAFAAIIDKLKTDANFAGIKNTIQQEEQSGDKMFDNANTTNIIGSIKPTTNFFEIGNTYIKQNKLGQQVVNVVSQTDPLKLKFENARKLLFKANELIDKASKSAAPETLIGLADNPAANTALKHIEDSKALFLELFTAGTGPVSLKGDAYHHIALAYLAKYRALGLIKIFDETILAEAKKILYEIKVNITDPSYSHLAYTAEEMLDKLSGIANENDGIVQTVNPIFAEAEKMRKRAEDLRNDFQGEEAIAEFDKAFNKYEEAYKVTDATMNQKMREAALFFGAHSLYNSYQLAKIKSEDLKNRVIERLKIFILKHPNSEFAYTVQDLLNQLNNQLAAQFQPGTEFAKAINFIEKLRFYYKSNASTTEIEVAFNAAEAIFRAIVVDLSQDIKHIGTVTGDENLRHFRAKVKFHLAILYMERYVIPRVKTIKFKNAALQMFNELTYQNSDEPFIAEVKNFIAQLQNDGKQVEEFVAGKPIITNVVVNPASIDLDKLTGTSVVINISANVTVPEAIDGDLKVTKVVGEVKQLGNAIYAGSDMTKPITIEFARDAARKSLWKGVLTANQPAPGNYELVITASTADGKKSVIVVNYVVKPKSTFAFIEKIDAFPGADTTKFKVVASLAPVAAYENAPGKYTGAYVTLMQPEVATMTAVVDAKFMQSFEFAPVKLEQDATDPKAFNLDLKTAFPNIKQGSYIFLFKLINLDPANPDMSMNNPVNVKPFHFTIKKEVAGAAREIIVPRYLEIIKILGDVTKTAEDRVAAYEKMFENGMNAEHKNIIVKVLKTLGTSLKVGVYTGAEPEIEFLADDMVKVRAPWRLEGTYAEDLTAGFVDPEGRAILPPGRKGFVLRNFVIDDKHVFVKRFIGVETWMLQEGEGSTEGVVPPSAGVQAVVTEIDGKPVPAAITTPIDIQLTADKQFLIIKGRGFKPFLAEHKRALQLHGPNFTYPMFLADSGSFNWTDAEIMVDASRLRNLKDVHKLEIFDSKFGSLLAVPVRFGEAPALNVSVYIFELVNGDKRAPAFNLTRPFEIDKTKDLVVIGDRMTPPAGSKYSLMCYVQPVTKIVDSAIASTVPPTGTTTAQQIAVELLTSDDAANWTAKQITVKADVLKAKNIPGNSPAVLVVKLVNAAPVSSAVQVIFFDQAFDSNNMKPAVISSVNGYSAAGVVNIDRPAGVNVIELHVKGENFSAPSHRHLDLVFQLPGGAVHIPIADSFDATAWPADGTYIRGKLDFMRQVPMIMAGQVAGTIGDYASRYPTGLHIVDDMYGKPVTPVLVALRFVAGMQNMPVITKVNGIEFFGAPIPVEIPQTTTMAVANIDLNFEGQNLGTQSPSRALFVKPGATPLNPRPVPFQLASMKWDNTFIMAPLPVSANVYGVCNIAMFEAVPATGTGTTTASTDAFAPMGWKQISKDVAIDVRKAGEGIVASARISTITVFTSSNAIPQKFDPAQVVKVTNDAVAVQLAGMGLKPANGAFRILFMKRKGTVEEKYIDDSNSMSWTDTMIDLRLGTDKPYGLFEMYIVEPGLGNKIVSNIINLDIQSSQTGAAINMINGIAVQPGIAMMLKPDFTELLIGGANFGANTDNKFKVVFEPMADPMNPFPRPVVFSHTSWTAAEIKVVRPTDPAVKFTRGMIAIKDTATNVYACAPVQVSFGEVATTAIPMPTGLMYDATRKVLKWNPVVSTTNQIYEYSLMVDGSVFKVPSMTYEFPVTNLASGPHSAQVQAQIPNTYPPVTGPFSEPVNFSTEGGTASNIPVVTGIFYDPAMKMVRWQPVAQTTVTTPTYPTTGTTTPTTGTVTGGTTMPYDPAMTTVMPTYYKPYAYMIRLDGSVLPNQIYNTEFFVGNLAGGDHKIEIQAVVPDTYPPQAGPFSAPFAFNLEGGATVSNIPAPTGLVFDSARKALKWNPVTMPVDPTRPAAAPVTYMLRVDGMMYGPFNMTEFFIPAAFPGGMHKAEVQAQDNSKYPPLAGPFSAVTEFSLDGGTASALPVVQGFMYDAGMKKLKWNPVTPVVGTTAANYLYILMIDGMRTPNPVSGTEYMVDYLVMGPHKAQIQVMVMATGTAPVQYGPWSPATPIQFEVGTGSSLPAPTGLKYDALAKKLMWDRVAPPNNGGTVAYNVMIDGMPQGAPVTVPEYQILNLPAGMHVAQVQVVISGGTLTAAMMSPWSAPLNFSPEGTTTGVAPVTGLMYDPTGRKLKWNPVAPPAGTTAATVAYVYAVNFDGMMYGPFTMTEFFLPATVTTGIHNAQVRAQLGSDLYNPYSKGEFMPVPPYQFSVDAQNTSAFAGLYNGRFAGNPVPVGTINVDVLADGTFKVNGFNESRQQQFTSFGRLSANNELMFDVQFAEIVTYKGVLGATGINGTFWFGAQQLGMWNAVKGGTTTGGDLVFAPMPVAGVTLNAPINVTITWPNAPAGATIYYTLDGSDPNGPTALTYAVAGIPLQNNGTYNIKAVGKSPTAQSTVKMMTYVLGGTTSTVPAVSGLMYDAAMNKLKWNPVNMAGVMYNVKIDNVMYPAAAGMTELMLPAAVMAGAHTAQVQAKLPMVPPATMEQVGPWSPEPPLNFNVGTASNLTVTFNPIGGTYPAAAMSVTIVPAPADAKVYYTTDGTNPVPNGTIMTGGPVTVSVPANSTNFKITAVAHLNGATGIPVSHIYSTTGAAGTGLGEVTGIWYDSVGGNKIKWNPLTSTSGAVVYKVKYDNVEQATILTTTEFPLPANITGTHSIQVQGQISGSTPLVAGPWSPVTAPFVFNTQPTGTVANPEYNPAPPSSATMVTITCPTANAKIKYTTDGSDPRTSPTASAEMTPPVSVPVTAGVSTLIKSVAVLSGTFSTVVDGQFNSGTTTPAAMTITGATNGMINLTLTPAPAAMPVLGDFVVKQKVDANPEINVTITGINGTPGVPVLNVPPVPQVANVQSVIYMVSYKGGAFMSSTSVSVPASTGGTSAMTITNVSNGVINLNLTPAPTVAPAFADFQVKQKIDANAEVPVTISTVNGAANNPAVVLNVPLVPQTANAQNVVYMVSYKGGAFVNSSLFSVPASTGGTSAMTITNVSNGVINLNLTPAPTVAPAFADFQVKQKIDANAEVSVTITTVNGAANNPVVVLNVPNVPQTANAQNVMYMVSYKGGAFMSSASFSVPAQTGGTAPGAPTFSPDVLATPGTAAASVTITAPAGAMLKYSMMITNDGTEPAIPADPATMAEVASPVTVQVPVGAKVRIKAVSSQSGMLSTLVDKYYNNYLSGGTAPPMPTAVSYDPAMKKVTWATPVGANYEFNIRVDGATFYGPVSMNEFILPAAVTAGPHSVEVQTKDKTNNMISTWSAPQNINVTAPALAGGLK